MYCKYCGNQITEDTVFCPRCGKEQGITPDTGQDNTPKTRKVVSAGGLVFETPVTDGVQAHTIDASRVPDEKSQNKRNESDDGLRHRNKNAVRPMRDKNFTKFLEQPLPLRVVKIAFSVLLLLASALAIYTAMHDGVLQNFRNKNMTGHALAGVYLAIIWVLSAIIGLFVKYNRGLTIVGGLFLLLAACLAVTTKDAVPYGLYYALLSNCGAIIFLVSGVGGADMSSLE